MSKQRSDLLVEDIVNSSDIQSENLMSTKSVKVVIMNEQLNHGMLRNNERNNKNNVLQNIYRPNILNARRKNRNINDRRSVRKLNLSIDSNVIMENQSQGFRDLLWESNQLPCAVLTRMQVQETSKKSLTCNEIRSLGGIDRYLDVKTKQRRIRSKPMKVCAICLERFANQDRVRRLSCEHLFHLHCIDQWLLGKTSPGIQTNRCPICYHNPIVLKLKSISNENSHLNQSNLVRTKSENLSEQKIKRSAFLQLGNMLGSPESNRRRRRSNSMNSHSSNSSSNSSFSQVDHEKGKDVDDGENLFVALHGRFAGNQAPLIDFDSAE